MRLLRFYKLRLRIRLFGKKYARSIDIITNLLLLAILIWCFKIIRQSFDLDQPLWQVTRYHLEKLTNNKNLNSNLLYFKKKTNVEPLSHKTIRSLLTQENNKMLENSALNYTIYFEDLEKIADNYSKKERMDIGKYQSFEPIMDDFIELCLNTKLSFDHPERIITNHGKPVIWDTLFIDSPYDLLHRKKLLSYMNFDDIFLKDLNIKHKIMLENLPVGLANFYEKGSSGYVLIGGGKYSWFSLLAIQSLRKSGSKLPVELIIPFEKDIDVKFCDLISNNYNAKCITFEQIYSKSFLKKANIKNGYQYKSLAILGSSFENTMYLDSDVFSVENPDEIFNSEVFKKFGFITWPDYWRRTTSPLLYENLNLEISDKPIRFLNDFYTPIDFIYNLKKKDEVFNYHDLNGTLPDWSTEAGIFIINKSTHFQTLLLSLYYNLNGPYGYYPLLSQGGAGEGDKETWVLAAHVLNQSWYQVNRMPAKTYGTWVKDMNWIIDTCIVQVNPVKDWEGLTELVQVQEKYRETGEFNYNYEYTFGKNGYEYSYIMSGEESKVRIPNDMFYHLHSPKLDPWDYILDDLFTDREGKQIRNFGEIYPRLGWDFELWIWENIKHDICEKNEINDAIIEMKYLKNRDFERACTFKDRLDKRIEWLRKDGLKHLKQKN